jgi:adenylate cyclase
MAVEIERKFLVANEGWRESVLSSHRLVDGLLAASSAGKVRVRLSEGRAWITVKGERVGLSRAEFEYEVPPADAEAMLALCAKPLITKTRHYVIHREEVWSVDVHEGDLSGMVHAEIELETEDQVFGRPPWLGSEVTGNPRYRKRLLLATHPQASLAR